MKKISIEVQTLYTIELTFHEWWEIFAASDGETIETARERFKTFPFCSKGKDMQKLADALGFDGWQNAGYINKNTGHYICVMKNSGCTI